MAEVHTDLSPPALLTYVFTGVKQDMLLVQRALLGPRSISSV